MSSIQYIVTDLDGTLLNKKGNVSSYTVDVLKSVQNLGIGLILASGRDIESVYNIGNQFNMRNYKKNRYICLNGLQIFDENKNILMEEERLNYNDAKYIYQIGKELCFDVLFCFDQNNYFISHTQYVMEIKKEIMKTSVVVKKFADISPKLFSMVKKVIFIQEDSFVKKTIGELIKKIGMKYEIAKVENEWIEINPKHICKGYALRKYAQANNISLDEILVFGNGENDIDMIKSVKYGIATKNAFDEVKRIAYDICDSNDQDGIAKYIEEFLNCSDSI